ncbi:MAG TPA: 4-alpha-glucanotransferase [Pyrinomonadaceae bacterium]|nr:4-alpha-glucanotransferase [Pyrinomonadaceae bacterium]
MTFPRASGILLHPTSLPGRFGIGDLGSEAYAFADFLVASGQSLWQVLPLGPTGYGDSPYACYSAFAGNTFLISPERLCNDGWLSPDDVSEIELVSDRVDFGHAYNSKDKILRKACENYQRATDTESFREFEKFCEQNQSWLEDYALFRALKTDHDRAAWPEWEPALVRREEFALGQARDRLHDEIEAHKFFQFLFFRQWFALKAYCNERGIRIIGDVPIFVAHDSADVWTNPEQFKLDEDGVPIVVAGVPPDYFSATGQYWGNPLYDWDRMLADGFKWWIGRVRATLQIVDIVRIDHFRGFAACWEIPGGDKTAERGSWVQAPGRELFTAIGNALGELPIIAEDLGVITPEVDRLRDEFGFPGMRVLQFAFGGDADDIHLPHNYHQNVVAYTGTHDNDTTVGWFQSAAGADSTRTETEIDSEREFCKKYLHTPGEEIEWDFIRAVLSSVANTAIIPLQDVLGVGSEGRMNLPNSTEGNWSWRFSAGALTDAIRERLRALSGTYGRLAKSESQ